MCVGLGAVALGVFFFLLLLHTCETKPYCTRSPGKESSSTLARFPLVLKVIRGAPGGSDPSCRELIGWPRPENMWLCLGAC